MTHHADGDVGGALRVQNLCQVRLSPASAHGGVESCIRTYVVLILESHSGLVGLDLCNDVAASDLVACTTVSAPRTSALTAYPRSSSS